MDPRAGAWSDDMGARLGVDLAKLPPIRRGLDILGFVEAVNLTHREADVAIRRCTTA